MPEERGHWKPPRHHHFQPQRASNCTEIRSAKGLFPVKPSPWLITECLVGVSDLPRLCFLRISSMASNQKQHCSMHIPCHLQEPLHTGFMGSSKACHSPCLTLQSRWCSISQTAGAGSILSLHSFASACHPLLGKSCFLQPGKKHGKVVDDLHWQRCCSTLFFPYRAAQLLPPAYYTLHRCHSHGSAPTDFMLREAEQWPWLWVSFTLR